MQSQGNLLDNNKAGLNGAFSSPVLWNVSLPKAEGLELDHF